MAQSGASHWSERDSGELWLADGHNIGEQDDITTPETTSNNKTICSQHFNGGFTIEGINVLPQMTLPFICKKYYVSTTYPNEIFNAKFVNLFLNSQP